MNQFYKTSQVCSHHLVSSHHCLPKVEDITTQLSSGLTSTHLHSSVRNIIPQFQCTYLPTCLSFTSTVLTVVYHELLCDKVTVFHTKGMSLFCSKLAENHTVLFPPSSSLLHTIKFPPFMISFISQTISHTELQGQNHSFSLVFTIPNSMKYLFGLVSLLPKHTEVRKAWSSSRYINQV